MNHSVGLLYKVPSVANDIQEQVSKYPDLKTVWLHTRHLLLNVTVNYIVTFTKP